MKVGDKIRIVEMVGEPQYTGKVGVIDHIDSIGQLHGTWGGCAIQPDKDTVEVIKTCCICGKEFAGYGNNPDPVKSEGQCCDECNMSVVIPARLKLLK